MAAAPQFKVYDSKNKYQGSAKEIEPACLMAEWYGDGSTVRIEHAKRFTVYTEGVDISLAWDAISNLVDQRIERITAEARRETEARIHR
jgi:hypothetical protein